MILEDQIKCMFTQNTGQNFASKLEWPLTQILVKFKYLNVEHQNVRVLFTKLLFLFNLNSKLSTTGENFKTLFLWLKTRVHGVLAGRWIFQICQIHNFEERNVSQPFMLILKYANDSITMRSCPACKCNCIKRVYWKPVAISYGFLISVLV